MAYQSDHGVDLRDPKQSQKSLGDLFGELTSDIGNLFRKEVELAKVETKEEISKAGKAGAMLGAGAAAGYLTLILVAFALAWLLDTWMHPAIAFSIVAVVFGVITAVLLSKGRERLSAMNPVPEQTAQTLKEDVQWARAQMS